VYPDLRVRTANRSTSIQQEAVLTGPGEEHHEQLIDWPGFIGAERIIHASYFGSLGRYSADVPLAV
jgi:hypothetical protein